MSLGESEHILFESVLLQRKQEDTAIFSEGKAHVIDLNRNQLIPIRVIHLRGFQERLVENDFVYVAVA